LREHQRNDRSVGLARQQFELVHHNAIYDFEVDTSQADSYACAELISTALKNPSVPHAFARMKKRL
jgi:chloramphenicol 3-O-phosphotransferase